MSIDAIIALFLQYKYPALVALSFVEGPYIMMVSGFLIKTGVIALIPAFIALSFGDILGDIIWYFIGYYFGNRFARRFGKFFGIDEVKIENAKELFSKHRRKIIFGSKLTAGFGLSIGTLITAGIVRSPFGEYFALNLLGQIAWTTTMLSVGYFFGNLYLVIDNLLGKMFIVGVAVLSLYLLLQLGRRLGRKAKEGLTNKV